MYETAAALRKKLAAGTLIVGAHSFLTDSAITELFGYHGFEFVWIDGEHCAFTLPVILQHIQAAASAGTASLVRIAWNDPALAKPVLEMGPDGIIFPYIRTAEEARRAIAACFYPPRGMRGFGPRRANRYGFQENGRYLAEVDESFLRILQIEHRDAVENLEEILQVPGIDLVVVGPNDLSASYGRLGDTRAPDMLPIYDRIAACCKARGMPFGVSLGSADREAIRDWIQRGVALLGCGDDLTYMSMGSRQTLAFVQACLDGKEGGMLDGK
ncbi:MAG: 4-hydroxy-3-methylbut-2-en-1-yl diphosphate synthase [Oscillospiraceae bacterium]|nr:4-hydroxy-3-methylbut-2-en-1-yl diphosphate synthase [Oscillospiraceae bacterium]